VREQDLNLFAMAARRALLRLLRDGTGNIPRRFMNTSRDLAGCSGSSVPSTASHRTVRQFPAAGEGTARGTDLESYVAVYDADA
jgi:hypothetical protein